MLFYEQESTVARPAEMKTKFNERTRKINPMKRTLARFKITSNFNGILIRQMK